MYLALWWVPGTPSSSLVSLVEETDKYIVTAQRVKCLVVRSDKDVVVQGGGGLFVLNLEGLN